MAGRVADIEEGLGRVEAAPEELETVGEVEVLALYADFVEEDLGDGGVGY
jgi:hypothetical protein